ncbi:hypothetical protein SLITO_v1c07600 [Spiroplasma litorale]|uniref:Transmembrane protein n=2 Tax=Spiroplasma litorale TaxID=216942 RepID=A0A0K1W2I5_9MOLU|nr:hypothetical protein SLITO_v1c07600 [Spiroplasma litorale]
MCSSIFGMLIFVYVEHMVNSHWLRNVDYPFSPVIFQGQFLSFFTFQSNGLVAAYFLIRVIFYDNQIRFCKNKTLLLYVTSYITVTFITYVTVLFPATLANKYETRIIDWIYSLFLHIITPISTITYMFLNIDFSQITVKKYFKNYFLGYLVYPWFYTIYLIFRIFIFLSDDRFSSIPFEIVYPYAPVSSKSFDFGNSSAEDMIGNILYTFFSIFLLFIVVHTLFIIVNISYLFIIRKMERNYEKKHNLSNVENKKNKKTIIIKLKNGEEKTFDSDNTIE